MGGGFFKGVIFGFSRWDGGFLSVFRVEPSVIRGDVLVELLSGGFRAALSVEI
jgi:hypothetical protein